MAIEVNLAGTMPSDGVVSIGLQMLYLAHQQLVAAHEAALALKIPTRTKPTLVKTTGEEVVKSAQKCVPSQSRWSSPEGHSVSNLSPSSAHKAGEESLFLYLFFFPCTFFNT